MFATSLYAGNVLGVEYDTVLGLEERSVRNRDAIIERVVARPRGHDISSRNSLAEHQKLAICSLAN